MVYFYQFIETNTVYTETITVVKWTRNYIRDLMELYMPIFVFRYRLLSRYF